MLTVVVWKWKTPDHWKRDARAFTGEHVNTMHRMFKRHYHKPFRFVCITDDIVGIDREVATHPLWDDYADLKNPNGNFLSNYRRLKIFSKEMGKVFGPRILSLDLDTVIVDDITELLNRPEPFVGIRLHRRNEQNRPWRIATYGGAMYLMDAGAFPEVWDDFDPNTSPAFTYAKRYIGSDQAWMSYKLRKHHPVWTTADGVLSFQNDAETVCQDVLPDSARIIHFHGVPKPWDLEAQQYKWVRENWR